MIIYILDTRTQRAKAIGEQFYQQSKLLLINGELTHLPQIMVDGAKKLYIDTGNWTEKKPNEIPALENQVAIRLRHKDDSKPDMPSGAMQFVYSGSTGGTLNSDKYGIESGIGYQVATGSELPDDWVSKTLLQAIAAATSLLHPEQDATRRERPPSFDQPFMPGFFRVFGAVKPIKTLFIWPGSFTPQHLLSAIDPEFQYRHELFEKTIVASQPAWDTLADCSAYDLVVLPAELVWDKAQYSSDFHGVTIAASLRRKNFAGIILLASIAPVALIDHLNQRKTPQLDVLHSGYTYLWNVGSSDISLPVYVETNPNQQLSTTWPHFDQEQKDELRSLPSHRMSPNRLKDVRFSLLPQGKLSAIVHEVKTIAQASTQDQETVRHAVDQAFEDLALIIDPVHRRAFDTLVAQVTTEMIAAPDLTYPLFLAQRDKIGAFSPTDDPEKEDAGISLSEQVRWGVLMLEDNDAIADKIISMLGKAGIPVWWKNNAKAALDLLKTDYEGQLMDERGSQCSMNSIRVVLADIRLENPASKRWQIWQGYDFIEQVNVRPNFVTCIVLTQHERFMLRNMDALQVAWFPKDIMSSESAKSILIDKVLELGNNDAPYIPNVALFTTGYLNIHAHPFSVFYKQHRVHASYRREEEAINRLALAYFDLWFALYHDSESYQQVALLRENIQEQREGLSLTNGITEAAIRSGNGPKLFSIKMAARRAALYIAQYLMRNNPDIAPLEFESETEEKDHLNLLKETVIEICTVLKHGHLPNPDLAENIDNTLLNRHLGLSSDLLEWLNEYNLLLEEKKWLSEKIKK